MGIGSANQYGDIGGAMSLQNWYGLKDIQIGKTRPSLTFGVRYKLNGFMAAKLNLYTGFLAGNDKNSKNELTRNYAFKGTIYEGSVQYEYYLISEVRKLASGALYNKNGMLNDYFNINLYLFAGVGGVYANSKVIDNSTTDPFNDNQYKLFDGDGYLIKDTYWSDIGHSKLGLVVPFGVGVKYVYSHDWSFGAEFGRRYTSSDYLDGYAANQKNVQNKSKDVYDFMTLSVIYRINTDRRGLPILGRRPGLRQ
jgi:hypothetical protein